MADQYEIVEATFQPKRTDDLKPGMEEWIGRRCRWECLWFIEDDDSTKFAGQEAWGPADEADRREFPYIWVPTEDLTAMTIIKRGLRLSTTP